MSRGRKAKKVGTSQDWEEIFHENIGAYFKVIVIELGKRNKVERESASDLIQQIRDERYTMGLKINSPSDIQPNDMPFTIPQNWIWCRLNEIGESIIGIVFNPNQVGNIGVPVLRANNVQNNKIDYSNLIYVDAKIRDKQFAKIGDILICVRSGSNNLIGKSAIIEKEGMSFGAFMSVYRSAFNKFVHFFMTSDLFKKQIDDKKSTGINQLTQSTLNNIIIPLPPLSEQLKIVEFLNDFENNNLKAEGYYFDKEVEQKVVNLHKSQLLASEQFSLISDQLTLIENLNQAILQEAVQGKLVPQDPTDEPASELLKRLKEEKAKTGKKEKPLPPIKPEEIPFEIPDNWVWCRLGEMREPQYPLSYGVLVPGDDVANGVPFVRVQDLDFADREELPSKHISVEIDNQYSRTRLVGGEILICVVGSIGKVALAAERWIGANIARAVCRFMPNQNLSRKYLFYCLTSPFIQLFFKDGQKSINPTLNINILETTPIPLPPLSEQKRIVAEIENQLEKTKQLKAHVLANQAATEQLLKALLQEAFAVEEK